MLYTDVVRVQDSKYPIWIAAGLNMTLKHMTIVLGTLFVLGVAAFVMATKAPHVVVVKVALSGAEGLQVTGRYTADGKAYEVDKILPAEINLAAKRMSLSVADANDSGTLFAQVYVDEELRVSGGGTQYIKVDVSGPTMFSSSRAFLQAIQ